MHRTGYEIVGAPFDLGAPRRGGADAPDAMRARKLMPRLNRLESFGISVVDGGNVEAPAAREAEGKPAHVPELLEFSTRLMARLADVHAAGRTPVVLGGDHSISVPSVSAAAAALRKSHGEEAQLGLLWVDAHPDLETPAASPDGDLHGMPVAHLLGEGIDELCDLGGFRPKVRPENVAMVCLRDVVTCEREMIREKGIEAYTHTDVGRLGIVEVCERVFRTVQEGTAGFVLSFDLDVLTPVEAPAVLFPEHGGLTYREASILMEYAADAPGLTMLEVVELEPALDPNRQTALLACELIYTALGGRLLG
jgi:arginase